MDRETARVDEQLDAALKADLEKSPADTLEESGPLAKLGQEHRMFHLFPTEYAYVVLLTEY